MSVKTEKITIEDLLEKFSQYDDNVENLKLIRRAYDYAYKKHFSQKRITGDDYITHPLNVAWILTGVNADSHAIAAALLHDTIEDSDSTYEEIKDLFGEDIAKIVDGVTKINRLKFQSDSEQMAANQRKILVGLSEDVRVLIVKLADRLHNMRTLYVLSEAKQKRKAKETLEILTPVAHRLGMYKLKSELEDLSLRYLNPTAYYEVVEKLNLKKTERDEAVGAMLEEVSNLLTEHNINHEIKGRSKSIYSIYNKLNKGRKFEDIYDILALRVFVNTEQECYLALGLIHSKYKPVPKRFKDYIAMPKENMYQSLHTSVFGSDDNIYEVQVRTPEMDELAEHGIASHWSYKEHTKNVQNIMEQKLEIFRNTIKMASNDTDESFQKNAYDEILNSLIYVFTPKGDVMELPQGATPIDFAYRIHSGVGDKTVGAIVNDQIVPLDYELQDGDIIKINTLNSAKPNKEWLNFVKTTQAKNKIKAYFSKKDRENYIEIGKDLLEKEIRKQKLSITEVLKDDNIKKILNDLHLKDYEELLLSVGSLRYTPAYVINLVYEDKKNIEDIMLERVNRNSSNKRRNHKNDITVAGSDNILVTIAHCCNPVPGDEIIGFITKGEGVSVHKKNCPNIGDKTERLIEVEWNNDEDRLFNTSLTIKTNSMQNHLLEIVTAASLKGVSINSVKEYENGSMLDYQINIKVKGKEQLELFILEIEKNNFVIEVTK